MVWDKMWGTNLFPNDAMTTETRYYRSRQNTYGLPLDSRADYTKSDWIMWTAAMAENDRAFIQFMEPLYRYVNTTTSRVPLSDWYDTKTGRWVSFRARSVIGGHWMKVLMDKFADLTAIASPIVSTPSPDEYFDLAGRSVSTPSTKGIYIVNGKKVLVR